MNPKRIKKGDNLIYHNRVLRVVKIEDSKRLDEKCVVAEPYFVTKTGLDTLYTIPFSAFEEGNVRKLLSKTATIKLLRTLQHDTIHDGKRVNVSDINFQDLSSKEIVSLLQRFWDERTRNPKKFATSKKLMMNKLTRVLTHIVGAAFPMSLDKAEKKVNKRLNKRKVEMPEEEE